MAKVDLKLATFASLEAQCAAIADDIAYVSHDIDDGLRARLLSLDAVEGMPFAGPILQEVRARYPGLERDRLIAELIRRIITRLVEDVIVTTTEALKQARPQSAEDVRQGDRTLVAFSPEVAEAVTGAKKALFRQVYRSDEVNMVMHTASAVLKDLFETYRLMPTEMPPEWNRDLDPRDRGRVARRACDYVAGMTDRFCLQEFERLFPGRLPKLGGVFDAGPELR